MAIRKMARIGHSPASSGFLVDSAIVGPPRTVPSLAGNLALRRRAKLARPYSTAAGFFQADNRVHRCALGDLSHDKGFPRAKER